MPPPASPRQTVDCSKVCWAQTGLFEQTIIRQHPQGVVHCWRVNGDQHQGVSVQYSPFPHESSCLPSPAGGGSGLGGGGSRSFDSSSTEPRRGDGEGWRPTGGETGRHRFNAPRRRDAQRWPAPAPIGWQAVQGGLLHNMTPCTPP